MKISILTLFPEMFSGPFDHSIIKRAQERNIVQIEYIHIRNFGIGKHKVVDDTPYGGGVGMILRVDVLAKALEHARCKTPCDEYVILTDARGNTYNQQKAQKLSKIDHLILICGHYEAVDERITTLIDEKISIGDYVLTGGEIPSMVLVDSIVRLLPGVLVKLDATEIESHTKEGYLEFPQYTKPPTWNNLSVPKELLSGNHKQIQEWKKKHATNG